MPEYVREMFPSIMISLHYYVIPSAEFAPRTNRYTNVPASTHTYTCIHTPACAILPRASRRRKVKFRNETCFSRNIMANFALSKHAAAKRNQRSPHIARPLTPRAPPMRLNAFISKILNPSELFLLQFRHLSALIFLGPLIFFSPGIFVCYFPHCSLSRILWHTMIFTKDDYIVAPPPCSYVLETYYSVLVY